MTPVKTVAGSATDYTHYYWFVQLRCCLIILSSKPNTSLHILTVPRINDLNDLLRVPIQTTPYPRTKRLVIKYLREKRDGRNRSIIC